MVAARTPGVHYRGKRKSASAAAAILFITGLSPWLSRSRESRNWFRGPRWRRHAPALSLSSFAESPVLRFVLTGKRTTRASPQKGISAEYARNLHVDLAVMGSEGDGLWVLYSPAHLY